MSVSVNIRTQKELEPKQIFESLMKKGERIVITSDEFPCVKMGTAYEALRGIEVIKEDDGYGVRVCSFANKADLMLFISTTSAVMELTDGLAYYENDEESPILIPEKELDNEWIKMQMTSSIEITSALVRHSGKAIVMDGLFFKFCFGPNVAKHFGINLKSPSLASLRKVQDYFCGIQWAYSNKKNTSSRMFIQNKNDKEDRPLNISVLYAKDGEVMDVDYVSYADLFCLVEIGTEDYTMIQMEDFCKILPEDGFSFMDEYQFAIDQRMTMDLFLQMKKKAKLYEMEDLFYQPTFPGDGYDEKQRTFVLMWNPEISSVKIKDINKYIPNIMTDYFNWSVYEHEKARKGDRFVLVRCGKGKTGIVMSGIFDSNPYKGEDWSGKGRNVYYMEMKPNFIANSEVATIITTKELKKAIPTYDWSGGPSGLMLDEDQARQLDSLLRNYLMKISDKIDGVTINAYSLPDNFFE